MASVGSSHSAFTSGEDHEEASLSGCPPIGRSDEEEFRTMPPRNQARQGLIGVLYPRIKTPRLYGPLGKKRIENLRTPRCRWGSGTRETICMASLGFNPVLGI